jgi:hypothetical protein
MTAVGVAVANGQTTENSHDSSSSESRGIVVDDGAEENAGATAIDWESLTDLRFSIVDDLSRVINYWPSN